MQAQNRKSDVITDKKQPFRTFMHYTDRMAGEEITVFGRHKRGLFYNYDDRLFGDRWIDGLKLAKETATPKTAEFYEIALNHFHGVADVDLQHVVLGCNRSNGFSYLVFGYTYGKKST